MTDDVREQDSAAEPRAGYVTIIGEPNVGKSTLLNAMLGQKISIVTNKPQTTRHRILGILTKEHSQAIFLDTPGLLTPKYELHRAMMSAVHSAVAEADILLFMIDCTLPSIDARYEILKALPKGPKPVYLVINKIDRVDKRDIPPLIIAYTQRYPFAEVFPLSALTSYGVGVLVETLTRELPLHPWYYPADIVSEHPEKFFVSEIIREKIFENFREEIPYSTTVDILEFKEAEGKKDVISAEIYVERDSQKGILIGSGGKELKKVGEAARRDIESFLGRKVFLQLHVKVREKWRDDPMWVKRLGYK
jgi:GTP-binding protein Era